MGGVPRRPRDDRAARARARHRCRTRRGVARDPRRGAEAVERPAPRVAVVGRRRRGARSGRPRPHVRLRVPGLHARAAREPRGTRRLGREATHGMELDAEPALPAPDDRAGARRRSFGHPVDQARGRRRLRRQVRCVRDRPLRRVPRPEARAARSLRARAGGGLLRAPWPARDTDAAHDGDEEGRHDHRGRPRGCGGRRRVRVLRRRHRVLPRRVRDAALPPRQLPVHCHAASTRTSRRAGRSGDTGPSSRGSRSRCTSIGCARSSGSIRSPCGERSASSPRA